MQLAKTKMPIDNLDELFERYGDMIYRLAFVRTKNKADAEDIVQSVFLKYLSNAPKFNSQEHQKAWLLKVTVNTSNSLLSSTYNKRRADESEMYLKEIENETDVLSYVLELPLKYREAVHLHYMEGYSIKEIAEIMQAKESTVKSYLFRARDMLREAMKGDITNV